MTVAEIQGGIAGENEKRPQKPGPIPVMSGRVRKCWKLIASSRDKLILQNIIKEQIAESEPFLKSVTHESRKR